MAVLEVSLDHVVLYEPRAGSHYLHAVFRVRVKPVQGPVTTARVPEQDDKVLRVGFRDLLQGELNRINNRGGKISKMYTCPQTNGFRKTLVRTNAPLVRTFTNTNLCKFLKMVE